ncbi:LysE family translocator [Comamonas sp. 4034]|uniref:LysE family translocator n=1 Tax=Comamonas sp. 4034 TaxID=3156455 RepID=UPI003D200C73
MTDIQWGLLALYAASVVSLLATPGPVTLLVVQTGLSSGMRPALATIAGTNLASLVLIALAALLIQGFLVIHPAVFALVRLLGCLYICKMAWDMQRDARLPASGTLPAAGSALPGGFGRGFALAISNPKDIIFFSSFLPQFSGVMPQVGPSLVLLTVVWIVLDFSVLSMLALAMRKLVSPRLQRLLLQVSSWLLLLIGVAGLVMALRDLLGPQA